jgi:TBC1 domain family protein 5
MRAPDGSYEDGFVIPGLDQPPRSPGRQAKPTWNLETNNPLSLHREVRWVIAFPEKSIHQFVESVERMVYFY